METKANYVLVGIFTVVVLILSFGFVYWSANVSDKDNQVQMLVRIQGSVTGLSNGSQVLFNGLRVGDVRNLRIDPNDPRVVIATTMIDATTPITTSTRATIGFQGLTGLGFVELKGGDVTERNIIQYAQEQGAVPVIQADPSDVTDILATAKDIAERANNILTQFEQVVGDVGPSVRLTASNIGQTSENVKVFTQSLADNSGQIDEFLTSVGRLAGTANTVAEALPGAIDSAKGVLDAIDQNSVRQTVDNVAAMSQTLRAQSENVAGVVDSVKAAASSVGAVGETISRNTAGIDRFLTNLGPISDTASSVATKLDGSLGSAQSILAAIKPDEVSKTIDDISRAAENVSGVADVIGAQRDAYAQVIANVTGISRNLGDLTQTLADNKPAIERFMTNLGPISDTASSVATKLDVSIGSAQDILAAIKPDEVSKTIDDISKAAGNVSSVADLIGSQRDAYTQVIANVTGISRNLGDLTQTLADNKPAIERFMTNLGPVSDNAASASVSIRTAADNANQLITGLDRQRITETVDNVAALVAGVRAKTPVIQSVIDGLDKTVRTVDTTLTGFDGTRTRVDQILSGIDPATVNRTMVNVSSATDNVARAADSVASIANDIGARRDDINRVITDATQITAKVNTASTRLDTVLASLDRLLRADSTEGLAAEASATLKTFRDTAQAIQARIGPIADNIQNFSGSGLNEVRSLVRDVTRSVNRIEGAVTDFQSNPSRLIYGGDEVKQFDGRNRR